MTEGCWTVCTQLLVSVSPSEDSVGQFVALLERCHGHEAFTAQQRRRIASWKEQAHRIWNALPAITTTLPPNVSGLGQQQATARNNKPLDSRFARRFAQ